jgi:RNA polymerase sigma-70 factor (ECF subfamily)
MGETGTAEGAAELRPLLFSIAYRMLGTVSEAEDVVQEALVRYERARQGGVRVESPKAYLSAVVTRLAIDELRSARRRREAYVGEWLPEPLLIDDEGDPTARAEQAETLSMAFLAVLDRLNPVERAVFLLHDVFGYEYPEIAAIVGKSEVNCRQIAARARRRVREERPRLETGRHERDELADRFFAALRRGSVDELVELLAADAVVYGDGGGKAPQWMVPVTGADRVARLLAGLGRQLGEHELRLDRRSVNGQPGAVVRAPDGSIVSVFAIDVVDGAVRAFRSVINPDKLRHLGPVADLRAMARRGR